jgi:LPS-assembly protein
MPMQHSAMKGLLALGVSLTALGVGVDAQVVGAYAQTAGSGVFQRPKADPNAQMLLQADQLVYDNDAEVVTAKGNVQIDYDGYNLVASKVIYSQKTKRIVAIGNVEIIEPDGNKIYADHIDITDDFGDGFLNALRVETPNNTRFAAESAERFAGQKTVFNHGVYTACEPCKENPDKPPLWQVKAKTVILDGVKKTVTYRHARFELFGLPIAYLPYFSHADPSVKRKSGFLTPSYNHNSKLGYSIRAPYFLVTGPSHDLTLTSTWYSNQGFMGDVEWRHQLDNGYYTFKAAGISQNGQSEFNTLPDLNETERGMIATTGRFKINSRWSYGWNFMAQSDRTFSRTYDLGAYSGRDITNDIYLRGLHGRSYFELSAFQYLIQTADSSAIPPASPLQDQQAQVHPVLDYNYVKPDSVFGGQLSYDINVTSISRTDASTINPTAPAAPASNTRFHGVDGLNTRASIDMEWKRTFTSANGMSLTPSLSFEGSAFFLRPDGSSAAPVVDDNVLRAMPTFGLEYRWPILATVDGSSHVFEPIAQIFVRPDAGSVANLTNEDAQSFVFDTTSLFERNKYSGYDRLEGGIRANLGLRYSGLFNNGLSISALVGQSFHLAGENPYARKNDLVNAGEESGLETNISDYVAMAGFNTGIGLSAEVRGRFDHSDFDIRRLEASARYTTPWFSVSTGYAFIGAQPDYGFVNDREQATISGSVRLSEHWRAFGAAQFDIHNKELISDSFGVSYDDECFSLSLAFSESSSRYTGDVSSRTIMLRLGFRTIGDFQHSQSLLDDG